MAVLPIIEHPDPRLRREAQAVTAFDDDLAGFCADLTDTLHATPGIGLSAPQVGDPRRVLVTDLSQDRDEPRVFINPQVLARAMPAFVQESCLSVPGVVGSVMRHTRVRLRAVDVSGNTFEDDLEGMAAVSVLHELDHLSGVLFVDRLVFFRRWWFRLSQARARRAGARAAA